MCVLCIMFAAVICKYNVYTRGYEGERAERRQIAYEAIDVTQRDLHDYELHRHFKCVLLNPHKINVISRAFGFIFWAPYTHTHTDVTPAFMCLCAFKTKPTTRVFLSCPTNVETMLYARAHSSHDASAQTLPMHTVFAALWAAWAAGSATHGWRYNHLNACHLQNRETHTSVYNMW